MVDLIGPGPIYLLAGATLGSAAIGFLAGFPRELAFPAVAASENVRDGTDGLAYRFFLPTAPSVPSR